MDLWVVLGVIAAIVVPLYIYRRQRQHKGITFFILTRGPLLQRDPPLDKVELVYEDRVILSKTSSQMLIQAVVRIENTGALPIEKNDFEVPLRLKITSAELVLADVAEKHPPDLPIAVSIIEKEAALEAALLNPGDWISVQLFATSYTYHDLNQKVQVRGRVSGVTQIQEGQLGEARSKSLWSKIGWAVFISQMLWLLFLSFLLSANPGMAEFNSIRFSLGVWTFYFLPVLLYLIIRKAIEVTRF